MRLIVLSRMSSALSIFSEDPRKSEVKLINREDINIRPWNLIPGTTSLLVIVVNCCCTDLLDFVINWIIGHLCFALHSTPLINCK